MSAVLYFAMGPSAWWLQAAWPHKVAGTCGLVVLGAAAYGVMLLALGFQWRDFARRESP